MSSQAIPQGDLPSYSHDIPVGGVWFGHPKGTVRVINAELKIRAAAGLEAVLEEKAVGRSGTGGGVIP